MKMMSLTAQEIKPRADALASTLANSGSLRVDVIDGESVLGGGAAPSSVLPTVLIAIASTKLSADELSAKLRAADPPIVARIEEGRVLLDLRTVFPEQDRQIATALERIG
jgi:L-seryl-tRNA(Ser) seleniumtransferase